MYSVDRNSVVKLPRLPPFQWDSVRIWLNVDDRICIAVDRSFAQPIEVAIQMNPGTRSDVSANDFIRMSEVWHVFLSSMFPRNPNYLIACKCQISYLDAGRGEKTLQVFGLRNNIRLRPVIPLRQFSQHGIEAEFGQTPFAALHLMHSLSSLMPSFLRNVSICSSSSAGLRTQPG